MFQPFALFVGLRYSRTRRSSRFVSFISASSIIGIALGVMALILGLSAMNGFERELRQRVLAVLFGQPDIDGGLIGGAALKASDFVAKFNAGSAGVALRPGRLLWPGLRSRWRQCSTWPRASRSASSSTAIAGPKGAWPRCRFC